MTHTRRMMGLLLVVLSTGCAGFERQDLCQQGYDATQGLFWTLYVRPADRWADTRAWGSRAEVELEKAVLNTWGVVKTEPGMPIDVVIKELDIWMTHRFRTLTPSLVACIKRSTGDKGEPLGEENIRRVRSYLQGILYACRDQQFRPRVLLSPGPGGISFWEMAYPPGWDER